MPPITEGDFPVNTVEMVAGIAQTDFSYLSVEGQLRYDGSGENMTDLTSTTITIRITDTNGAYVDYIQSIDILEPVKPTLASNPVDVTLLPGTPKSWNLPNYVPGTFDLDSTRGSWG